MNKVFGGFKKWSIELDADNGMITVSASRTPIDIHLYLYDLCDDEIHDLANMFMQKSLEIKNRIENSQYEKL